jgi:sugar phosphate isomerase/epimerase
MRLCVSNIAWDVGEDSAIRDTLRAHGVEGVEVAPTKIWPNPIQASDQDLSRYRGFWEAQSMSIPALQSLLFGRPELKIFDDQQTREQTLAYLTRIMTLGAKLGATALVFGSPKNRATGTLAAERVREIAVEFFRRAGEAAYLSGTQLAIEPNPPDYGCDFIRTVREGADFVRRVDHPGFRLHVDASAMILNGEDLEAAIEEAAGWMIHFHISDPQLDVLGRRPEEHRRMARALRRIGWKKWISIEMRGGQIQSNQVAVERALQFAKEIYFQ